MTQHQASRYTGEETDPLVVILLGLSSTAWRRACPLTTLRAIHAVTNAEPAKRRRSPSRDGYLPRGYERNMFVQDGDVAIYVRTTPNPSFLPGDRVLVTERCGEFSPIVIASSVTLLHTGPSPSPCQPPLTD